MPVTIAVVGCGRVARSIHLANLRRMSEAAVVALVDPDPMQRELALKICPQAQCFAQLDQLWPVTTPDAVLIAAPPWDHAGLAMHALQHGAHVYVEKPLAANPAEADALISAWKKRPVAGMVGFNYRFHPLFLSARHLLSEGAVGKPLAISTILSSAAAIGNDWRARRGHGGGVLLDLASHHVDLVHFLLGSAVTQVHAQTSSVHCEEGTATLQMRLENEVLVSSVFSYACADQHRVEVFGDRGILRIDLHLSTACEVIPRDRPSARFRQISNALSFLWRPRAVLSRLQAPGNDPSYRSAVEHFVEAVRSGSPCAPDFQDGARALRVVAAAEQSANEGRWFDIAAAGGAGS